MSINGKRDGFTLEDLRRVGEVASLKRGQAEQIHDEVLQAVKAWPELAARAGIDDARAEQIGTTHRIDLPPA
jgi:serine/threonine-protein kinase HipA